MGTPSQGRSPYAPCDLLKKVDQNFYEMEKGLSYRDFVFTGLLFFTFEFVLSNFEILIRPTLSKAFLPEIESCEAIFNLAIGQSFSTLSIFYMPDLTVSLTPGD